MSKDVIDWGAMQSIREKLYRGRDEIDEKGKGATLTAAECSILLRIVIGDLKIRGGKRGPKVDHHFRDIDHRHAELSIRSQGRQTNGGGDRHCKTVRREAGHRVRGA